MPLNIDFGRQIGIDIPDSPISSASSFDDEDHNISGNSIENHSNPVNDSKYLEESHTITAVLTDPKPPCRLAIYRNTSVHEFVHRGTAVMRRVQDGWVNATNLLKAGGLDQKTRDEILKRDVMLAEDENGIRKRFEKVRVGEKGRGHLAIDGIWVPFEDARALAAGQNILDQMAPIFGSDSTAIEEGDAYSQAINIGRAAEELENIVLEPDSEKDGHDGSDSSGDMSDGSENGDKNLETSTEQDVVIQVTETSDTGGPVTFDAKLSEKQKEAGRAASPSVRQRAERISSPLTDTSNSGDERPTKNGGADLDSGQVRRSPRLNKSTHADAADSSLVPKSPVLTTPVSEVPTVDSLMSDSPPASQCDDEIQEVASSDKLQQAPSTPTSSTCSGTTLNGNGQPFVLPGPATTTKPSSYPFLTITDSHVPLPDIASGFRSFLLAIPNGVAKSKEDAEARTTACLEKLKRSWDHIDPSHWMASCQLLSRIFHADETNAPPPSSVVTRPSIIARLMCNDATAKSLVSLRRVLCQGEIRVLQSVVRKALHEKSRELDLVKEEVEALRKKVATTTPAPPKRGQLKRAVDRADQLEIDNKELQKQCEEKEVEIGLLHGQVSKLGKQLRTAEQLSAMHTPGEDRATLDIVHSLEHEVGEAKEGEQKLLARIEELNKAKVEAEMKKPRRNKKKQEETLKNLVEENEELRKWATAAESQRAEKVEEADKQHAALTKDYEALEQELAETKQHAGLAIRQKKELEDKLRIQERFLQEAEERFSSVFGERNNAIESESDEAALQPKTVHMTTNDAERKAHALQMEVISCTSRLSEQTHKLEDAEKASKRANKVAEKLAFILAQHETISIASFDGKGFEGAELVKEKAKFLVTSCLEAVEKEEKMDEKNAREAAAKEEERRIKAVRAQAKKRKKEGKDKAASGIPQPTTPVVPQGAASTAPVPIYADVPPTPDATIAPPPPKKRRTNTKNTIQPSATPAPDPSTTEQAAKKAAAPSAVSKKRTRKPAQPAQPDYRMMLGGLVNLAAGFLQNLKMEPDDSDAEDKKTVKRRKKRIESSEEESEAEDQ